MGGIKTFSAFEESDTLNKVGKSTAVITAGAKEVTRDSIFKNVFGSPEVLAYIIKSTVDIYEQYSVKEIIEFMMSVDKDKSLDLAISNEDARRDESLVRYDIFTTIKLPDGCEGDCVAVKIYFDLEMQRKSNPGYPLEKRAVYYTSRMISSQKSITDKSTGYGDLQPVYSIWVVLTKNSKLKNSVVEYKMCCSNQNELRTDTLTEVQKRNKYVELQHIKMIYVDESILTTKEVDTNLTGVLEFLSLMFANKAESNRMSQKHLNFTDSKLLEEVNRMMTIEEEIRAERAEGREEGRAEGREEGRAEGREELLFQMIRSKRRLHLTEDNIMQELITCFGLTVGEAKDLMERAQ